MENTFSAKIRQVGSSLGVLVPKEAVSVEGVQVGEIVQVTIHKQKRDIKDLLKLFGSAKGAEPFVRECEREF